MNLDTFAAAVVGSVLLAIYLFARKGRAAREAQQTRREHGREASKLLKELNQSLGFPEGTGPTGIMVDGEYRVVNLGHTDRMKSDPVYAFGNQMASITMELLDLENALEEAEASGDKALAAKIRNELAVREREAHAMIDQHQSGQGPRT
jgi:hypothetical protein